MKFHYLLVDDLLKKEEFERRVEEKVVESGDLLDERAAAMLREDLTVMGGIPHSRAVEAQEEIMDVLRKLSSKTLSAQHEVIAVIRKLSHDGLVTVPHFQDEAGEKAKI